MTVTRFIIIRGIIKALLSIMLVASLCYGALFSPDLTEGRLSMLAGLVGMILQHYFQRDTDSPRDEQSNGVDNNDEEKR